MGSKRSRALWTSWQMEIFWSSFLRMICLLSESGSCWTNLAVSQRPTNFRDAIFR